MLKRLRKRCIASLLIATICGGIVFPTTFVYAAGGKAVGDTVEITNEVSAQLYEVPNYYGTGNTLAPSTTMRLIQISYDGKASEIVGWSSKVVNGSGVYTSEIKTLNGDSAGSYSNVVLSKIDTELGVEVTSENILSALNSLGQSQGASTASLSNLNQRMAALLYMRLNPDLFKSGSGYKWESVSNIDDSDYSDILTTTLEVGHDEPLRNRLVEIGIVGDLGDEAKSTSANCEYSTAILGVMGTDAQSETGAGTSNADVDASASNGAYSIDNHVYLANEMALYICLCEYLDWYIKAMPDVISTAGWEEDEANQSALTYLKIYNDAFGDIIPVIRTVYNTENPNADNMSIAAMVDKCGATDMTIDQAFDVDVSTYVEHTDNTTPITQFYTVNSDIGITSYDRDAVLNDIEVDSRVDDETAESLEEQRNNEALTGGNAFQVSNEFLSQQKDAAREMIDAIDAGSGDTLLQIISSGKAETILGVLNQFYGEVWKVSIENAVEDEDAELLLSMFTTAVRTQLENITSGDSESIQKYLDETASTTKEDLKTVNDDLVNYGVDEYGVAKSYSAVTINSYIMQGMAYSTTFIPMRTNLYAPDTVAQFQGGDPDGDFFNFYIDYGFMRKALYMDTSATAAVDYYNANGTFTGSLKICTLRDLVESGDNDVVLYLDSNFYNAADAIDSTNQLLTATHANRVGIYESLSEFAPIWSNSDQLTNSPVSFLATVSSSALKLDLLSIVDMAKDTVEITMLRPKFKESMLMAYKFDIDKFETADDMTKYVKDLSYANSVSSTVEMSEQTLKTNGYTNYNSSVRAILAEVADSDYVNLSNTDETGPAKNAFSIDMSDNTVNTDDNLDTVVLTSSQINQFMSGEMTYSQSTTDEDEGTVTTNNYTADTGYTPLMSVAYVSCLYRDSNTYTLANTVESNNPVFMASDDLCGIEEANQWYRNTLLNYALLKNLKGNAQIDVTYVTDLDCPVYMDVFGNIITESGIVVIPAASNATLHVGSYRNYNYSAGLYSCYGKEYNIPSDTEGAQSVLYPYFVIDKNVGKYVVNGITMNVGSTAVRFDKIDTYSEDTRNALMDAYKAAVSTSKSTRLNWIAMVKIVNEVMRGAPIENINKDAEGLYVNQTKAGLVAAAKLESMLDSLKGEMANTLLYIPDFSKTDKLEVWVALLMKLMMVATAAVVIISIYRDGVAGTLGPRTALTSLAAIALTVSCIVVVPSVFQLTYYSANKFLLEDEAMRILMVNEEKRQGGVEIGITKQDTVQSNGEFAIQLDWVKVPWYEELENILYDSALDNLQEVKLEAYRNTAVYNNADVTMYNDGAYVTTDDLFDSVSMDYTFTSTSNVRGLYLYANDNQPQTASFYSPYYVFLRTLTANVNEYNRWLNNAGDSYVTEDDALADEETGSSGVLGSYNYTVKYMSENRPKTVGLCSAYFTSDNFMEHDEDIMRLCQIYGNIPTDSNPATEMITEHEKGFNRAELFSSSEIEQLRSSYWYNNDMVDINDDVYWTIGKTDKYSQAERRNMYAADFLEDFYARVDAMDAYARDFIASNRDMLGKVSDETFIKVMALNMAVKYNQLFGVPAANSLEIYNMDSEDLIRLCTVASDEAVMATSMSYPRFIYVFGGEAGVYVAAILSVIMWLGSFIKPLCTIIVFISVFMSIFVFRVVLRKPSANLWGYCVTVALLCVTNLLHALVLKIGVSLPNFGLSPLGCLIFLIVGQVAYLLLLAYVTGVSLKDWSNLGASEYEKEANLLRSKLGKEDTVAMLSGRVKHHDYNWDYYNDLVDQHRKRNSS